VPTQTGPGSYVRARIRLPDGRLGHAQTISSTAEIVAHPQIGVAGSGDAWAVWAQAGRHIRIMAAFHPRGKAFGSAYVVWAAFERTANDDVHTRLRMAVIRRSNRHGPAQAISGAADGDASQPSVAVRPGGTAEIAWRASLPAGGEQNESAPIMAAASTPDMVTSPPQVISTHRGEQPVIGVDRQGEAILAWDQFNATPQIVEVQEIAVAVRPAAASPFGAAAVLSPANAVPGKASLAIDAVGTAYLAYYTYNGVPGTPIGLSHVRPPGGAFGAPIALPATLQAVSLLAAGPKVSAVGGGSSARVLVSDWMP
jgi:hypothetical protein